MQSKTAHRTKCENLANFLKPIWESITKPERVSEYSNKCATFKFIFFYDLILSYIIIFIINNSLRIHYYEL